MRDLILTGFMGTGKTTVGRLLAQRYGFRFVDLDEEIERSAGRGISEIFSSEGEESFRRLETEALRTLPADEGRVVATGGGALLSPENRDLLRDDQMVVCLTCRPEEIERRLGEHSNRPLLHGRPAGEISRLLALRRPVYDLFEQIDTTGRAPEEIVEVLGVRLGLSSASILDFESRRTSHVIFERGLLGRIGSVEAICAGTDVILVTDQTIASLGIVAIVVSALESRKKRVVRAILPPGEVSKSLESVQEVYALCQENEIDRQAAVLGIGGGMIGDLAGMVAATYLRGLRLILAPTTLVAQADAAIGGKVGVDFRGTKNLIGAFHPAEVVLVDPDVLRTLPGPALADGMAEIVKIALIRSAELLEWLEALPSAEAIVDHPAVIRRAACEKVEVVRRDPFERGERALLNFGHTVGHALEAASGYRLSHGQAISTGMVAEAWLGEGKGWCSPDVLPKLIELLDRFGLPTGTPPAAADLLLHFLWQDKKRAHGQIRLALPTVAGDGAVFSVEEADIRAALDYIMARHAPEGVPAGGAV